MASCKACHRGPIVGSDGTAPRAQRTPEGACDRALSYLAYIAGVVMEAGVSNAQPLSMLASQAVDSLSGIHYAIADAIDQVPSKPGLYAVYADPETWQELNLDTRRLPTVRRQG